MPKGKPSRIGKSADDLFTPTTGGTPVPIQEDSSRPRGRPPSVGPTTKVTVALRDANIVYLDGVANDIRAKTGAVIKRSELLRAIIEGIAEAGVDLTTARTEEDIKNITRNSLSP